MIRLDLLVAIGEEEPPESPKSGKSQASAGSPGLIGVAPMGDVLLCSRSALVRQTLAMRRGSAGTDRIQQQVSTPDSYRAAVPFNSQRTRPGRSVAVRPQRAMPGLFAVVRNGVVNTPRPLWAESDSGA